MTLFLNFVFVGVFMADETFAKSIPLFNHSLSVVTSGKCIEGTNEYPFEFELRNQEGLHTLVESYHGANISIVYTIQASCDRGMMKKALLKETEFCVEIPSKAPDGSSVSPGVVLAFEMVPDTTSNRKLSPQFHIIGNFNTTLCRIQKPLTGEVVVKSTSAPLKFAELQLVRLETILLEGKTSKVASEIQNIQIMDGNVCRDLAIPIYMIFPRLYSCPTIVTPVFKVEFEVNLIIYFNEGFTTTKNFPIIIARQ